MQHKLLIVDNDGAFAEDVRGESQRDLVIEVAESGPAAIGLLASNGPYSVVFVISDSEQMRRAEFLDRAQESLRRSVVLFVLGDTNRTASLCRYNNGQIDRLMSEGCSPAEAASAIDEAITQFERIESEKEQLQGAFSDAIRAFAANGDARLPGVSTRSNGISKRFEQLRTAVGFEDRWEFRLACLMTALGVSLLPADELERLEGAGDTPGEPQKSLTRSARIAARLLDDAPGLGDVARICARAGETGKGSSSSNAEIDLSVSELGAMLLRIATHWDCLERRSVGSAELVEQLKTTFPEMPPSVWNTVQEADEPETTTERLPHRVLFVDDEASILKAISRTLNFQLDITTAYSGDEGLHLLGGPGEFDVVVTDLNMPGMHGIEFIRKAAEINPALRFVVLSGGIAEDSIAETKSIPSVTSLLEKPVNPQAILDAISAAATKQPALALA